MVRQIPSGASILLLPPVRSNRLAMLNRAKFLAAVGYSTLLIDFRAAVYSTIDVAVQNRLRIRAGSFGAAFSPVLLWPLQWRTGTTSAQLRPIDHIGAVRAPVFVIGGTDDRHTTLADTQSLFAAAPEPKELWVIPGIGHVDFMDAAGDEYQRRVLAFLHTSFAAR